jgi:hypothetical protein
MDIYYDINYDNWDIDSIKNHLILINVNLKSAKEGLRHVTDLKERIAVKYVIGDYSNQRRLLNSALRRKLKDKDKDNNKDKDNDNDNNKDK